MNKPTLHILTTCFRTQNLKSIAEHIALGQDSFDLQWRIVFDGSQVSRESLKEHAGVLNLPFVKYWWRDKLPFWGNTKINPKFDPHWAPSITAANRTLWDIEAGWFWIHDDDTLVHPDFFSILRNDIERFPLLRGWIFGMQGHLWQRRARPEDVRVGQIDIGQYVLERTLIGDIRYTFQWGFDGIFIESIYKQNRSLIGFDDRPVTYHNWLRLDL